MPTSPISTGIHPFHPTKWQDILPAPERKPPALNWGNEVPLAMLMPHDDNVYNESLHNTTPATDSAEVEGDEPLVHI